MDKLHEYQGWAGRFHEWQDQLRERYNNWRQENPETGIELIKKTIQNQSNDASDYSHVHRYH